MSVLRQLAVPVGVFAAFAVVARLLNMVGNPVIVQASLILGMAFLMPAIDQFQKAREAVSKRKRK